MKNLLKITVVALVLCSTVISCTKSSLAEDQNLYEQGTEGDDGDVKKRPGDDNE